MKYNVMYTHRKLLLRLVLEELLEVSLLSNNSYANVTIFIPLTFNVVGVLLEALSEYLTRTSYLLLNYCVLKIFVW